MALLARETGHFPGGARRLDGAALRDQFIDAVRARVAAAGDPPVRLATVVDGDDAASLRYVGMKHRAATRAGMATTGRVVSSATSQAEAEELLADLVADPAVHGILVQLPLPTTLDEDRLVDLVDPAKDVDGLTATNLGLLVRGTPGLVPATPLAVLRLLEAHEIELRDRRVTIVGRTALVGVPLSLLLAGPGCGADVTVCHPDDPRLGERCREADIVVSDACRAHLIGPDLVRPGATVVDVGSSWPDGRLVGDVDTDAVARVAGALSPNPGGAGPMTVACLLENTLSAAGLGGDLGADLGAGSGPVPRRGG